MTTKYPIKVVDTMNVYIAFATQDDAAWYKKAWPDVVLETAFDNQGNEYLRIMRDGKQVGIRWFYD